MEKYEPYLLRLNKLLLEFRQQAARRDDVREALNGEAARQLRRLVPVETRKSSGAFFTAGALVEKIEGYLADSISQDSVIYDPACGAGDLLLAAARAICSQNGDTRTIEKRLIGRDVHSIFIRVARNRMALQLMQLEVRDLHFQARMFRKVRQGDGLGSRSAFRQATHIVLNPPYGKVEAPQEARWGSGRVSEAAVFMSRIAKLARPGSIVMAILPDVLRSGSNYEVWRDEVSQLLQPLQIDISGQFDHATNVHTCLVQFRRTRRRRSGDSTWHDANRAQETVSEHFTVSVGSVVDFRDKRQGESRVYLSPKHVPSWERLNSAELRRKSERRPISSPFVIVRRMSRVGDRNRAVATLVDLDDVAVVDNHFIVLKPIAGGLEICEKLMDVLRHPATDDWLDQRIRCRHLTVGAVRDIPWLTM